MLRLLYSNRMELLAAQLIAALAEPPERSDAAAVLAPETVIVQSRGMARWLQLVIAQQLGICAHIQFPLPAGFFWSLYRTLLAELPSESIYSSEVLTWRLLALLERERTEAEAGSVSDDESPLRRYLEGDDEQSRYELAVRLARLFEQYLIYRPDWIEAWECGEESHWQARLWRQLSAADEPHRLAIHRRFLERLAHDPTARSLLPPRVFMIGVPALAPLYLDTLAQLSEVCEVQLFLLNPSREYWGDILAERDPPRPYGEVGNELLASLGKQGRDFIDHLQELPAAVDERYVEPSGERLLDRVQREILDLRQAEMRGADEPAAIAPDDRSIQLHLCHSPMREVEVLRDQLLALFEREPSLRADEIVVMAPDIELYAPLVEAVFGSPEEPRLPYSIADRTAASASALVATFLDLLDLPGSRYHASSLLAPLEISAIRRRFDIEESELSTLRHWLRESGVRWGIDAAMRERHQLPVSHEHTWRSGIERMLLGYALPGEGRYPFMGILGFDEIEGSAAQRLGRLLDYLELLFGLEQQFEAAAPAVVWSERLHALVEALFLPDRDEEEQVQGLREAIGAFAEACTRAGLERPLPLTLVRAHLRAVLEQSRYSSRFLTGGITFCALMPMRSVPFRVIALLGMDDVSFPRRPRQPSFDRMAERFRRGDRSRREDDRYLFLELLLSARDLLYISYVGRSVRDNSERPPSVLVSELLDYLAPGHDAATIQRLLTHHPLQPFDPAYFRGDSHLFSYSAALCRAAAANDGTRGAPTPLFEAPLSEAEAEWRELEPKQLIQFLQNPARYLLQRRLGLELDREEELLERSEPFQLDWRDRRDLRRDLLERVLEGEVRGKEQALFELIRAAGKLPHGQLGRVQFQSELARAQRFAQQLGPLRPQTLLAPIALEFTLPLHSGPLRLGGWLREVSSEGVIRYSIDRPRPLQQLALWIEHLLLTATPAARRAGIVENPSSRWVSEGELLTLRAVSDPLPLLQQIAEHYWLGLHLPLPFMPRSAFAYAEADESDRAMMAAQREWSGSFNRWPEGQNPYYQLAFRGRDPLGPDFVEVTESILRPLLAHRSVEPI